MFRSSTVRRAWFSIVALLVAPAARAQEPERLALYIADVDTGEVKPVATEPLPGHAYCGSPDWSYDGKRILLDATPGKQWNKTHMLLSDFPVPDQQQFTDLGPGNCPTWSPDAKRIAFLLNPGAVAGADSGIWIMNADGKERRRLGGYGMPEWSPDGKRILTISFNNPCNLTLLDADTGNEQDVKLPDHTIHSVPGWAGDWQTLIAVIRANGPLMIALLDISEPASAKVKEVLWTRGQGTDAEPLHPVFSVRTGRCVFVGRTPQGSSLYVIDTKRSVTPKPLEPDRYDPKMASLEISPDGRQLLFCSLRQPSQEEQLKLDLETLQGRWERVTGGERPGLEVLLIEGNRETFTLERKDGTVIRTLAATIELERAGDVRIYNRTQIKVVAGSVPPNFAKAQSFIYKFDGDILVEVIGLLHDRTPSRATPGAVRWQRTAMKPVTPSTGKTP